MGDLTAEELAELRIPLARLPGFDPVGLRVLSISNRDGYLVREWSPEVAPRGLVRVAWLDDGRNPDAFWSALTVTLTDSSTRDRVARWVAGRVGLPVASTAPFWRAHTHGTHGHLWFLSGGDGVMYGFGAAVIDRPERLAPALAGLDPADARRLPDGSRFADALALVRVAVHLGGQP